MEKTDGSAVAGAARTERGRLGVLRQREFRLLWLGETASGLGTGVTLVALPLVAVVVLRVDATAVGLLSAALWLPWLLIALPAGAWVDRLRKRPLMMVCNVVRAVLYASIPVAAWLDALTYAHLLVAALGSGAATVLFKTAYQAFLPEVLDGPDLVEGNAKLQGSEAGTQVVGRGVAGPVAQAFGAVLGLLLDAVTFLVSTACLAVMRVRERPAPGPENSTRTTLRRQIGAGLRFVFADAYLRTLVTYAALVNLAVMGAQAVQVVFLVRTVGAGPTTVGLLVMAGASGGVLGALLAGPVCRRLGTARGLLVTQMLTGPFALLVPLTRPGAGLLFFGAGWFVVSAGIVVGSVVIGTFRQRYCPPSLLGRATATSLFLNHGVIPVGSLLGGLLGDVLGLRPTMWIMTALYAPCWLVLVAGPVRGQRELPQRSGALPAAGKTDG